MWNLGSKPLHVTDPKHTGGVWHIENLLCLFSVQKLQPSYVAQCFMLLCSPVYTEDTQLWCGVGVFHQTYGSMESHVAYQKCKKTADKKVLFFTFIHFTDHTGVQSVINFQNAVCINRSLCMSFPGYPVWVQRLDWKSFTAFSNNVTFTQVLIEINGNQCVLANDAQMSYDVWYAQFAVRG